MYLALYETRCKIDGEIAPTTKAALAPTTRKQLDTYIGVATYRLVSCKLDACIRIATYLASTCLPVYLSTCLGLEVCSCLAV